MRPVLIATSLLLLAAPHLRAEAPAVVKSAAPLDPRTTSPKALQRTSFGTMTYAHKNTEALPTGNLGNEQFRLFQATWVQFYLSVIAGSAEALRPVVENQQSCKGDRLAIRAELLMERRAKITATNVPMVDTMRELIIAVGPKIHPGQLGDANAPDVYFRGNRNRVTFGAATFVAGTDGLWRVDLGC